MQKLPVRGISLPLLCSLSHIYREDTSDKEMEPLASQTLEYQPLPWLLNGL